MKTTLLLLSLFLWTPCFAFQTNYTFVVEKLWDFTGDYVEGDAQYTQNLQLVHQPSGIVVGSYVEDYDTAEITMHGEGPITGRVLQSAAGLSVAIKTDFNASGQFSDGDPARLTFKGKGALTFSDHALFGVLKGRGCATRNSTTRCDSRTIPIDNYELDAQMTGPWMLALDVSQTGSKLAGNAIVTLSNGRVLPFAVVGSQSKTRCAMRLIGNGEAIGRRLVVTTDTTFGLRKVTGRLLGQTIRIVR